MTWKPIFDAARPALSIGEMALAPSDPLVIWVGRRESNGEQKAAALGDGVYRSPDGGETWAYMGLRDTRFIHRAPLPAPAPLAEMPLPRCRCGTP